MDYIAYVCGILSITGSITIDNVKGNYRIYLETKKLKPARMFAEMLSKVFDKQPKIGLRKNKSYYVVLYGKKYVETLLKYISVETRLPKLRNETFILNFLRGVFDFNSTVRLKKRKLIPQIRVNSKKVEVLKFVKDELKKLGINSSIYRSGSVFTLEVSGKSNVLMFLKRVGGKDEGKIKKLRSFLGWYEKSRPLIVEVEE